MRPPLPAPILAALDAAIARGASEEEQAIRPRSWWNR